MAGIFVYNSKARPDENLNQNFLQCAVIRKYSAQHQIKTAHIVLASVMVDLADYLLGHGARARLFKPDNCLMLYSLGQAKLTMIFGGEAADELFSVRNGLILDICSRRKVRQAPNRLCAGDAATG